MNHLRHIILMVAFLTMLQAKAQESTKHIKPFITAGWNYSRLTGLDPRNSFNVGGGAIIPLFRYGLVGLRPQLLYSQKGARSRFEVYNKERIVNIDANYIEMPIDMILSGRPLATRFNISALVGPYFAYGIGGKTTASKGIYIYNRYQVGDSPSTFGDEMNGRRFDCGLHLGMMTRYNHFFLTITMEAGLKGVMDSRITRSRWDESPTNFGLQVNAGYEL